MTTTVTAAHRNQSPPTPPAFPVAPTRPADWVIQEFAQAALPDRRHRRRLQRIPAAIATVFADAGADLVITSRDVTGLEATRQVIEKKGRRCLGVEADLRTVEGPSTFLRFLSRGPVKTCIIYRVFVIGGTCAHVSSGSVFLSGHRGARTATQTMPPSRPAAQRRELQPRPGDA